MVTSKRQTPVALTHLVSRYSPKGEHRAKKCEDRQGGSGFPILRGGARNAARLITMVPGLIFSAGCAKAKRWHPSRLAMCDKQKRHFSFIARVKPVWKPALRYARKPRLKLPCVGAFRCAKFY